MGAIREDSFQLGDGGRKRWRFRKDEIVTRVAERTRGMLSLSRKITRTIYMVVGTYPFRGNVRTIYRARSPVVTGNDPANPGRSEQTRISFSLSFSLSHSLSPWKSFYSLLIANISVMDRSSGGGARCNPPGACR